MARPISDEELELKKRARRRLVGAIVLVTAVAVILPMVLDSEPKPVSQNVDIQIPSPDAGEFKPKGAPAAPAAKAAPEPQKIESVESKAPETKSAETKPETVTVLKDEPKSAPAPAKSESPKVESQKSGSYVVQVAALSDTAKAKQLEKQMAAAGLDTYTEVVPTPKGDVTRVRAGPYATREAAEKARTQLKQAGLEGKVVAK